MTEEYEGREWRIDDLSGCGNSKTFECPAWTYDDEGNKIHGTAHYHSDIEDGGEGEWDFSYIEYDESEDQEEEDDEDEEIDW